MIMQDWSAGQNAFTLPKDKNGFFSSLVFEVQSTKSTIIVSLFC